MATAFEEALISYEEDTEDSGLLDYKNYGNRLPSYVVAGDTLSNANGNETFLQQAYQNIDSVKKFIGVSMISGANQLYNIPTSIGNFFPGVDKELRETSDVINALDSDLGAFYEENKDSADLVGFLVSSMIPGIGGVKALNAGQTALRTAVASGRAGGNVSRGFKLLDAVTPNMAKYKEAAIAEVRSGAAPARLANLNARKAIAAGFGQNALEAVAFEVAVTATLHDSPVLENQDFTDFLSNIAWGAGVFGAATTVVDAAKINFALTKASRAADNDIRPWVFTESAAAKSTPEEQILIDLDQLHNKPPIPEGAGEELTVRINQAWQSTEKKTLNRIRASFAEITKKDQEVAEALYDVVVGAELIPQMQNMRGLVSATRMGTRSREVAKLESAQRKIKSGEFDLFEYDDALESYLDNEHKLGYLSMYGDDIGNVTTGDRLPTITRLVDTISAGEKITVDHTGVKPGGRDKISFSTGKNFVSAEAKSKPDPIWDPTTLGAGKQGHEVTLMNADARYMWADNLDPLLATLDKSSKANRLQIHMNDLPLLQKLYADTPDAFLDPRVIITGEDGINELAKSMSLRDFISARKEQLSVDMLRVNQERLEAGYKTTFNQDEIAAVLDIRPKMLNGIVTKDSVNNFADTDLFARKSYEEQYSNMLASRNHTTFDGNKGTDFNNTPMHLRLVYDTSKIDPPGAELDNFWVANMSQIKAQQRIYIEDTNRAADTYLGEASVFYNEVLEGRSAGQAVTSQMVREQSDALGAGASGITAASQNYGTLAEKVNSMGNATSRVIGDFKTKARETLNGPLNALIEKREAAIEFSVLNARLRNIPQEYTLNEAGDAFIPVVVKEYDAKLADFQAGKIDKPPEMYKLASDDIPMEIPIENQEVADLARAHIDVNSKRVLGLAGIRASQGVQLNRSPEAFYPTPVNIKDFNHFAIVIDKSVSGTGHSKMLYANSANDLESAVAKMRTNPQFEILFKKEAEDYYRARGRWEYEKTVNSNYIDTEALRKGVSAPALPPTDPGKIVSDFMNWHMDRETGMVRESVSAKFETQFEELRRLGDEATVSGTSKTSDLSLVRTAEETVKNPYVSYIKTALAIDNTGDYPFWLRMNQMADEKISAVLNRASDMLYKSNVEDDLSNVSRLMEQAGFHTATYDAEILKLANSKANRGILSKAVQKANSMLATVVLRWDALNAINNAVSANVLLGAEAKAVIRAIESGDSAAVGKLTEIAKIAVPGTDRTTLAPSKLISNSIAKFHKETRDGPTMTWFRENGFITSISDQYKEAVDDLTYHADANVMWRGVNKAHDTLVKAGNKGEQWTGNKFAEEFNRFVAADTMKQLTDILVDSGKMGAREQVAYINTFVNRTQGNYLASQRPAAFKGPIGQAIGLFQTYQFNLMQQLLRHISQGQSKDYLTLLALQGTIHGMNGLPAFNAVNTHIIGNASGNVSHRDAYDATYGVFGKGMGDLLTYGLASNALGVIHPDLKINLYTRGDLNPRHVTVVPTNAADIPVVQATAKFLGNIVNTANTLSAGGDVATTLLQGLEHNGISRPLAGIAQTLEALNNPNYASYSTSKRGNIIAANDLLSLANLSRMVGGKPLDEALAIDASFRFKAYGLKDAARRAKLGKAIKTTVLAGNMPTQEQIEGFAQAYAEAGGRQEEFAQWFSQIQTDANSSQVNEIQRSLTSPFTEAMQRIMGGRELRDFSNE